MLSFQSTSFWKLLGEAQRDAYLVVGSFMNSLLQKEVYIEVFLFLFQKRENTNATCAPMLLSAVLIWTSTWPSILWSWWVQTLRTLSALSLLKAAMERSTLITTGEDPGKGCAPAGNSMSYLPAKVLQGGAAKEVFVLPISDFGWAAKANAVWLG